MADKRREVIVPIVFDDALLSTDLAYLTDTARTALDALRREIEASRGTPSVYHLAHERLAEITARDLRKKGADAGDDVVSNGT